MREQDQADQEIRSTRTRTDVVMKYIWLVFPAIVVAWVVYLVAVVGTSDKWQTSGQFGDLFGGFTALVSGLAFAGILIAILLQRQDIDLQRQDLSLQRQELALQRQELARSALALEQQNATLRITAELNARAALLDYFGSAIPGSALVRSGDRSTEHAQAMETMLESLIPSATNDEENVSG